MANGIQVPVASMDQPRSTPSPQVNTYRPRVQAGGQIAGRFTGGPGFQADTSAGEGLAAFGRGLGQVGNALELVVQRRQNIEAMANVNAFYDREREHLATMQEMKGRDGAAAAYQYMMDFYDKEGPELLGKSRGLYQEKYYASVLNQSRDSGLNTAMRHSIAQEDLWEESVLEGQMATVYENLRNDPDNAAMYEAEMDDIVDAARPGMDNTAKKMANRENVKKIQSDTYESKFNALLLTDPQAAKAMLDEGLKEPEPGTLAIPDGAEPYMPVINEASTTYSVPQEVILAVIQTESGFRPGAVSPTNVKGLMQVTSSTYKSLGFTGDRADPRNSVMAGTKLLSQLYAQYGNWKDALTAYNSGDGGVQFMKTGKWPQSSLNYFAKHGISVAQKSREARNYAVTVDRNMRGIGQAKPALADYFPPEKLETMNNQATQAIDGKYISDQVSRYEQTLFVGTPQERAKVISEISNDISKVKDQERRALMLRDFNTSLSNIATINGANDMKAQEDFLAQAAQEGWNASQMLAQVDNIKGMTRDSKDKLKKNIQTDMVNKATPQNEANLGAIMVAIDQAKRGGSPLSRGQLSALNLQGGLTVEQARKSEKYWEQGGINGQEGLAGDIENVIKQFNPEFKGDPSAPLIDSIARRLPAGKKASLEEIQKATAEALLPSVGGYIRNDSIFGIFDNDNETYQEAKAAGKADDWLPDVTAEEEPGIDLELQAAGLAVNDRNRAIWKKSERMGLPLSDADKQAALGE